MTSVTSSLSSFIDEPITTKVFHVQESGTKRRIRLEVAEPMKITEKDLLWSSTFTTYLIRIETNHYAFSLPYSSERRRYSEFCWLRSKLVNHHPNKVVPPLPPKNLFALNKFDEDVIEKRRYGLGKFLQRCMRSQVLLSDSALHLFLQSDLSTKEIDKHLSDELPARTIVPIKNAIIARRPYLFRSVSCSSDGNSSQKSIMSETVSHDEYDDVSSSSSEEFPELELSE